MSSVRAMARRDVLALLAREGDPVRLQPAGKDAMADPQQGIVGQPTQAPMIISPGQMGMQQQLEIQIDAATTLRNLRALGIPRQPRKGDIIHVQTGDEVAGPWTITSCPPDGSGLYVAQCSRATPTSIGSDGAEEDA